MSKLSGQERLSHAGIWNTIVALIRNRKFVLAQI